MLLFAILDGFITRLGLALGATELNPFVYVPDIGRYHILEIQIVTIFIVLNALFLLRTDIILFNNTRYEIFPLRTISIANKWIAGLLMLVFVWNFFNIVFDWVLI